MTKKSALKLFCLHIGVIGAWKIWYRRLYQALQNIESSATWNIFFVSFVAHTVFTVIAAIGISETALAGIFFTVEAFDKNSTIGLCSLIATFSWGGNAMISSWLLKHGLNFSFEKVDVFLLCKCFRNQIISCEKSRKDC